jgi:hypothetical protein
MMRGKEMAYIDYSKPIAILLLVLFLLVCGPGLWVPSAGASSPTGDYAINSWRSAAIEHYRGGYSNGYGRAHTRTISPSVITTTTTGVSSVGVNVIHFINTGSVDAFCSFDGTTPTTSNCHALIPGGTAFTSKTKSPITTIKMYTPATGTTADITVAW